MKKMILKLIPVSVLIAAAAFLLLFYRPRLEERERLRREGEDRAFRTEHSLAEDLSFRFDPVREISTGLFPSGDGLGWYAYLPSQVSEGLYLSFQHFSSLTINDVPFSNGDNILPAISEGEVYTVRFFGPGEEFLEEALLVFYFTEGLPSLFLTASENAIPYIEEDKLHSARTEYVLFTAEGKEDSHGNAEIRCRGNTSFACDQKPYNLKLDFAAPLLGMTSGRKWALLANSGALLSGISATTQQLKNKIVYDLALDLNMEGAPESEFVNLYCNGEYRGLYLLSEKVDPDRIPGFGDLEKKNHELNPGFQELPEFEMPYGAEEEKGKLHGVELSGTPGNLSGGYLLEMDQRYKEEKSWFSFRKNHIVIKSPKEASLREAAYIYDCFAAADSAVRDDRGIHPETGLPYTEYLDLDSWAKLYLIEGFFLDRDIDYSSLYFYKKRNDGRFYAGPVWDFDLTMGEITEGTYHPRTALQCLWFESAGNKGLWLSLLDDRDSFRERVSDYGRELFFPALDRYLEDRYDDLTASIADSVYMNSRRWQWGDIDFAADAAFTKEWLRARRNFLDNWERHPETFTRVTFRFAWGNLVCMAKTNEPLGFLPLREYGEDDRFWGEILRFDGPEGQEFSPETPVTEDILLTAVYEEGSKGEETLKKKEEAKEKK